MPRLIRRIYDERPQVKMWDTYLYLESEPAALNILTRCYEQLREANAKYLAYQNTASFIYFLKQAREYYRTARTADLIVKPLLLYYGMMSLTKAYVLTLDPYYPSHTGLLRHGLTTRKRKKRAYRFQDDELKVQKDGLLPHVLTLLGATNGLQEKYVIRECLGQLPQLYNSFRQVSGQEFIHPVFVPNPLKECETGTHTTMVYVDEHVLDTFHLSATAFVHMLNRYHVNGTDGTFTFNRERSGNRYLAITWKHPQVEHVRMSGYGFENTMFLSDASGQYYLRLTTERRLHVPEFVVHLLLLFHLGMLARYETERWGEIVFTFGSDERYLIHELLQQTERHFPNLLLNEIMDEQIMFQHP